MMIGGDITKQSLVGNAIIKDRGRQLIDCVDSCESSFTPKWGRKRCGKKQSTDSV
jgi:hypothetical protein